MSETTAGGDTRATVADAGRDGMDVGAFGGVVAAMTDQDQLTVRMGIEVVGWEPGRIVGTMPVAGNRQPYGLLHGGASAVLAESLGSIMAAIHAGPDRAAVGVEISATHHRAARSGVVTGVCVPIHEGGSVATYEIVITDEEQRRICTARLTCVIRQRPPQ